MRRVGFCTVFIFLLATFAHAEGNAPVLTKVAVGDSACRIEWKPTPGAIGYNVYLKLDDGSYSRLNSHPIIETYVRVLDLINGQPYRFGVTAVDYAQAESPVVDSGLVVPLGYGYNTLSFKGGARAANYHLITVPYQTSHGTPEDLFGYFPEYETSFWRFFSFGREGYSEYGNVKEMKPGQGFWYLAREDTDMFLSGHTQNIYQPFKLNLHEGWNLIGSPFLFPVSWDEVLRANPSLEGAIGSNLWGFENGGFDHAKVMEPFKGYYLFNGTGGDIEVAIPPAPRKPHLSNDAEGKGAGKYGTLVGDASGPGWVTRISASDGLYRDSDNLMGVALGSPATLPESVEPPAWPQHLSLYFVRGEEKGIRRSTDIRDQTGSWTFYVEGGESDRVTLTWERVKGASQTELVDMATGSAINMSLAKSYSFKRSGTVPRRFLIREHYDIPFLPRIE